MFFESYLTNSSKPSRHKKSVWKNSFRQTRQKCIGYRYLLKIFLHEAEKNTYYSLESPVYQRSPHHCIAVVTSKPITLSSRSTIKNDPPNYFNKQIAIHEKDHIHRWVWTILTWYISCMMVSKLILCSSAV